MFLIGIDFVVESLQCLCSIREIGVQQSYSLLKLQKLSATEILSVTPLIDAVRFCPKSQHSASSLLTF